MPDGEDHGLPAWLARVRDYYDQANAAYLKHVGTTFQAGLVRAGGAGEPSERASNLFFAEAAGIRPGEHVLDAGCGVGGPAIDIAGAIAGVTIQGVTISPAQAASGAELVRAAGLGGRVAIHVADYHALPFAAERFDVVLFLESCGYGYDRPRVFAEAYRVLRRGGRIYVKDVFRREALSSAEEQEEIAAFDRIYAQRTPTMTEIVACLDAAGFRELQHRCIDHLLSTERFSTAMVEELEGARVLSDFGRLHFRRFTCLPAYFGDLRAVK